MFQKCTNISTGLNFREQSETRQVVVIGCQRFEKGVKYEKEKMLMLKKIKERSRKIRDTWDLYAGS